MMIEDEELRDLYKTVGEERLQRLEAGLIQLEENPEDEAVLRRLRREIHSLKGDSRSLGLEDVASLTQWVEDVLKRLQAQDLVFMPALSNALFTGLNAIERLVYEAVTGEPSGVDVETMLIALSESIAPLSTASPAANADSVVSAAPVSASPTHLPASTLIDDIELREIYRTTSEERLQKLEAGLAQLEQQPTDAAVLTMVLRQLHSLKGDSRSVGLEAVETLSHQLEATLKRVQAQELVLTSTVSSSLYLGLATIGQLVHEAVTGEPSDVDLDQVMGLLVETTVIVPMPQSFAETVPIDPSVSDSVAPDPVAIDPVALDIPPPAAAISSVAPVTSPTIEDAELREVYRVASTERLQKLEAGLVHLENRPNDTAILAELLRQAHSLKGDSSSTGIEAVETLTHQFEEVLTGVQRQEIILTSAISDRLYASLDAIGQLVREAVTGEATQVDTAQVLADLIEATSVSAQAVSVQAVSAQAVTQPPELPLEQFDALPPTPASDQSHQIDTVRVQTRDLDALMSQAEELAVTRIQTAQTVSQMEQIALLWQEWKTRRHRNPRLSAASLTNPDEDQLEQLIYTLRVAAQDNQTKLDRVAETLSEKIRTLRLLPLSIVFQRFPRLVRDLAKQQSKAVKLLIEGGETTADKQLLEGIQDALTHLIRNAIDHGIEPLEERRRLGKSPTAKIWLRGYKTANSVVIEVTDDGRGLDLEQIKQTAIRRKLYSPDELQIMTPSQMQTLILSPGFSTRSLITEVSGRGVGLDVVRTTVDRMKGRIQIESTPGQGCTFRLQISTSLSTLNVVLVDVQGILCALPFEALQATLLVTPEQLVTADDRDAILLDGQPIPVANLVDVLELAKSPVYAAMAQSNLQSKRYETDRRICVLLKNAETQAGFFVDRLLDTQEVVIKPQSRLLKRVRNVMGATTLSNGEVCMILHPTDLIQSLRQPTPSVVSIRSKPTSHRQPVILLVEDSPPVRIQEKRLFESAGYEVVMAIDGADGYDTLKTRNFDAVVSDIEMPNLDGLSLTAKIRQHPEYQTLPVILVTTLSSDDDRRRGAEAGANAYITKGKFNQEILLETLEKLVG